MFKESLDDMCTSSSYYSSLSNNSADNIILFSEKSSLQNLIPSCRSILEILTHQNFILKLPDLYQAKIKPKISSLILTVKASNFEYCLFSRNNFRADLSILFQQGRHSLLCNQRAGLCNKRSLGVEF